MHHEHKVTTRKLSYHKDDRAMPSTVTFHISLRVSEKLIAAFVLQHATFPHRT